jgi:nickel-dependent lactate racemase
MAAMFDILEDVLARSAAALDYLVALGTHQPMTDEQLGRLVGRRVIDGHAGGSRIFNHRWDLPETFATLGTIPACEVGEITGGLLARDVVVALNRLIFDYDRILVCGPVFPHEVVGFSGGNKYLFPGIAGPDIINFTHWLGALLSNFHVIGSGYTKVRAVIDRAARLVDRPVTAAYLSAAQPRVQDAVAALRHTPGRVVVATYLLAPGFFADLAARAGADLATAPLLLPGKPPAEALVDIVLERFLSSR